MESGLLRPDADGKIYLSRFSWEDCFVHGGDRPLGASFVVKVKLNDAESSARIFCETPGVRGTVIIRTNVPIHVEILEMYVRRLHRDTTASLERIAGNSEIRQYLNACGATSSKS